jgi:hypothetical protein
VAEITFFVVMPFDLVDSSIAAGDGANTDPRRRFAPALAGVRPLAFPRLVLRRSRLAVCLEKRWACALLFLQCGSQNVHEPISLVARPITLGNSLNAPLSAAFGITAVNARKYLSNG